MSNSVENWEKKLVGKVYVAPGDAVPAGKQVIFIVNFLFQVL